MQNPNVSKITTIDPDTMAETVIFERKAGDEIIFRQNETLLKTGKWNEITNKLEKDSSKIRVSGSCKNPVLPTGNVYWTGTKGDSYWIPDDLYTPINIKTTPAGLSWAEIKNKYNISEVEFINGEPVFNEVSKGNVCITNFTSDRTINFRQADIELARKKGCTPKDVSLWRKKNNYTWHECQDCKTLMKIPTELHGNIVHSGGISVLKAGD